MSLKNFSFYELGKKITLPTLNHLNDALSMQRERPLGKLEKVCDGFIQPLEHQYEGAYAVYIGRDERRWHRSFEFGDEHGVFGEDAPCFVNAEFPLRGFSANDSDALMLRFYREEKVLVSSYIKRQVHERVKEIEEDEARKVYTKERNEIRDSIINRILPGAQTRRWHAPVIFFSSGFVAIGAVGNKADLVAANVRHLLGTFPIQKLRTVHQTASVLTAIAKAQANDNFDRFQITSDFQFQATTEHPAVARCKNTDITDDNIQGLLEGKFVSHAAMRWTENVSFKIDPKMQIHGLRVNDTAFQDLDQEEDEMTLDQHKIATMIIEYNLVNQMLSELVELHGGAERREGEEEAMNETLMLTELAGKQPPREEEDDDE